MWMYLLPLVAGVAGQSATPAMMPAVPSSGPILANRTDPSPLREERLVSFNSSQADLRWNDNRWQLEAGGVMLKDFGRHEADARAAVRLVRSLNLNQHGQIGTPRPVMEYWLSNGQAPTGPVSGFRPLPFDPAALKVDQVQGQWCVRDSSRVLFSFGGHEGEAREALEVIQRHGFNRIGQVGRGGPTMLVFLAAQDTPAPAGLVKPETPAPVHVPSSKPPAETAPTAPMPAGAVKVPQPAISPTALPQGRQLTLPASAGEHGGVADRIPIEWRQLQVRREGRNWTLVSGGYTLADFGPNEHDARLAQSVVQFYRLSEHCVIGQPTPVFRYFLSAGHAPRGMMLGVEKVPFRTEELAVRRGESGWVVGDTTHTLFRFGENETAARQALKDIQFHHFDMLCRVGHGEPNVMNVLVRSR